MPLLPAVFLILLTLKLCGVIAVSWWIVFSPLIAIAVLAALFLVGAVALVNKLDS